MKKLSIIGLVLGALAGVIVALIAGGWLFWLGLGLAIGLFLGSMQSRRAGVQHGNVQARNPSS
jgi:high-affinity Fe2+/Pb2+ permease